MAGTMQLRACLQSLPIVTFTATSAGLIDWVSDRWYEATGIAADAVIGEAWVSVVHPDDVEHVVWLWTRALNENVPWEATPRVRHADGAYRLWFTRAERVETGDADAYWVGTTVELSAATMQAIGSANDRAADDGDAPD